MDGGLSLVLLGNGDATFRVLPPSLSGVSLPGDARSLTVVDFVGNHRPDLLLARNAGEPQILFNNSVGTFLKITAPPGSSLEIRFEDGRRELCQISAGSGYLSQTPGEVFISIGSKGKITEAAVRWPDGRSSVNPLPANLRNGGHWKLTPP
jgi:hypothetical protein